MIQHFDYYCYYLVQNESLNTDSTNYIFEKFKSTVFVV